MGCYIVLNQNATEAGQATTSKMYRKSELLLATQVSEMKSWNLDVIAKCLLYSITIHIHICDDL